MLSYATLAVMYFLPADTQLQTETLGERPTQLLILVIEIKYLVQ